MRGFIFFLVITCYFSICYPQSHQPVSGIVSNAQSGLRIGSVLVKNLRSGSLSKTNDHGEFHISVMLGDTLVLYGEGYADGRIIVEEFRDKVVQLQPSNSLAEVVVKAIPLHKDLQEVEDGYVSNGIFYKGKPPMALLSPFGGSPLTFFYELTSKDALQARRFAEYSTREQEHDEISKRYNEKVILSLVPVKEKDLSKFRDSYKPTIIQIRKWNDVELYNYIKESYREFISK